MPHTANNRPTPADANVEPRLAYSERDLDRLGVLSRKTRWRMRRAGTFPQPRAAGGRTLYVPREIHEWLDDPEGWAEREVTSRGGEPALPSAGGRRSRDNPHRPVSPSP